MLQYKVSDMYTEDCIKFVCSILNEFTIPSGREKTPNESILGTKPNSEHLVPFMARRFAHITKDERMKRGKFTAKAEPFRNLGQPTGYKHSNLIINPRTRQIKVRHDIKWDWEMI